MTEFVADINPGATLVQYLLGAELESVGKRVWGERDNPPSSYKPDHGSAICFRTRGGIDDDTDHIQHVSVQVKVYGKTEAQAQASARELHLALQHPLAASMPRVAGIKWARREAPGQTLREPETGWVFVLVFYKIMFQGANHV